MSYEWYIILKIVRQNIAEYVEIQWSRQPESLNSIGYRLCVLASGSLLHFSLKTRIIPFFIQWSRWQSTWLEHLRVFEIYFR